MPPAALRRVSRTGRPAPSSLELFHTSTSAASASTVLISPDYLAILEGAVHLSRAEEDSWANETLRVAQYAREAKAETRRRAVEEAQQRATRAQQE